MKLLSILISVLLLAACNGGSSGSGGDAGSDAGPSGGDSEWLIPVDEVLDGGPGKDGIPAVDNPLYVDAQDAAYLDDSNLVVGVRQNGITRAYPHRILDWHEIVNVTFGE